MNAQLTDQPADDAGVTLVELIIYILIAALIAGLMASILANGLSSEAATRDRDTATGKAQLVNDSLTVSIRNATAFRVDGSVLRARVATGASSFECRGWALTAGTLRYTHSASALSTSTTSTWSVLATGASGTLTAGAPFVASGQRLSFGISISAGDSVVPLSGGVVAQATSESAGSACW